MIRGLAFGAALRGTAGLSWLVPQALRFTRWLAPAGMRAEVDRWSADAELVEACGAVVRLTDAIEAAWDTRDNTTRTIEQGKAFERSTIQPLMQRRPAGGAGERPAGSYPARIPGGCADGAGMARGRPAGRGDRLRGGTHRVGAGAGSGGMTPILPECS